MNKINKIKQLLTFLSFVPALGMSQTTTENYVKTTTMLDAKGTSSMSSVQYYNGLGFPTVAVATVGGNGQTAYSLATYDASGREECNYLPVAIGNSMIYRSPEDIIKASASANNEDKTAYSQNHYDALDRITSVELPGKAWRDADKRNKNEFSANTSSDYVKRYVVSNDKLTQNKYYPKNSLTKETSMDADENKVEIFKDLFGNVVLQRVYLGSKKLDTYYVYDNLGFLRFVLPPKYQLEKDVTKTCYRYRYDKMGRLITKNLPGCDSITYIYDKADRMIRMRDPRLRSAGKYRFFIYDNFGRMVIQGVCKSCPTSATVRNAEFSSKDEGVLGTGYVMPKEYTDALKEAQLEIANYYDKNQDNIKGSLSKYFSDIKITTTVPQTGQLTGSVVAASNGEFTAQLMVYDIKGNLTNSRTKELGGRITSNRTKYTFTNKVKFSETYVGMSYGGSFIVTENIGYKYDRKIADTLTVNHGTDDSANLGYTYDKLGRLSKVTRPFTTSKNKTVSYTYDMHGWLKSINTSSFKDSLFYADGPGTKPLYNGNISSIKWKDNSSAAIRGYKFTYDKANRMTAGVYGEGDKLDKNLNRYTEKMTYDENGNVTKVLRYGKLKSGYGKMDSLTISYNGNQPITVSESVNDYDYTGSFEYKKANNSEYEFNYKFNKSGSLIADRSRGIAYITYDLNNNPEKIYFTNGSVTRYVYSASGQKLRAVHYTAKPNIKKGWGYKPAELTDAQIQFRDSTDYLLGGSLVLQNGKIDKFLFEGGYAQAEPVYNGSVSKPFSNFYLEDENGNIIETSHSENDADVLNSFYNHMEAMHIADRFSFYYYNQDHLGNNREVVDAKGVVQQVTNYYPFGAPYADASASKGADVQPYKYNGKELDLMHGLNTYDYGARQYNPVTGRWDRMDPLCEKYYSISPYAYCANNPVKFIDPDGRKIRPAYVTQLSNRGHPAGYERTSSTRLINAMTEIGRTTVGNRFIASFLEKGARQYGVTGNGEHANYTLNIYSVACKDPTEQFRIMRNDSGKLRVENNKGKLEISLYVDINSCNSNEEMVETVTHEIGLHGTAIDSVIKAYEKGGIEAAMEVYDQLTENDHVDLKNGNMNNPNVVNYKSMQEELERNNPQNKKAFQNAAQQYNEVY